MAEIKDLEILEKYLSQDELKEVAKKVAFEAFKNSIGKDNPHNKSNYEFYLKQACFDAAKEHMIDFDYTEVIPSLQKRVLELVKSLNVYNLPNTYVKIAEEEIEKNRLMIEDKVKDLLTDFVSRENYNSAYTTFSEYIGDMFSGLLHNLLKEKFQKA